MPSSGCQTCGMATATPDEFHPWLICQLKRANPSRDPWADLVDAMRLLGIRLPTKPPRIGDLPLTADGQRAVDALAHDLATEELSPDERQAADALFTALQRERAQQRTLDETQVRG